MISIPILIVTVLIVIILAFFAFLKAKPKTAKEAPSVETSFPTEDAEHRTQYQSLTTKYGDITNALEEYKFLKSCLIHYDLEEIIKLEKEHKLDIAKFSKEIINPTNPEETITQYTQLIGNNPHDSNHYICRSYAYCAIGDYFNAILDFEVGGKILGSDYTQKVSGELAELILDGFREGKLVNSDPHLTERVLHHLNTINDKNGEYNLTKAQIFYHIGKYEDSFELLNAIIDSGDDSDPIPYLERGRIYFHFHDTTMAKQNFEKALEVDAECEEAKELLELC